MNNSWFAQHGDKALSLLTAACALASTQAAGLGLNPHVIAWITFISGVATAAHTLLFPNTPPALPPPASSTNRQGGFVSWAYSLCLALLLGVYLMLIGCTSLGLAPAQTTQQKIAYGYSGVVAALSTLAQITTSGLISPADATQANTAILAVKATLDQANAATTSNAPLAATLLDDAAGNLARLSMYLSCKQTRGATTCQL